jgi:hypothetical protein
MAAPAVVAEESQGSVDVTVVLLVVVKLIIKIYYN